MTKIGSYFSLVKFSHTLFAMPFAMVGFFMATHYYGYNFEWYKLLYVILSMVFARNAAMAFNRFADMHIDKMNIRTSQREIPAGLIKPSNAMIFVVINSLAFILVTWFINRLCFYLSPVALFVILVYSYTKRFTFLSHYVLGIGLGLAPIGAFIAVSGVFKLLPVILGASVWAWVSGFDILYSIQDEEFDRQNDLFSVPSVYGVRRALIISRLTHLLSAVFMISITILYRVGYIYTLAVAIFCALLVYQHIVVKISNLSRINFAFFNLNGLASILFALLAIADFLI